MAGARRALAVGLIAIAAGIAAVPHASAATFTVDTTKDGVDANLADAVCAAANGKCTLRAAVDEANDEAGNDEIDLPKGTFKLTLAKAFPQANNEGEIDVTEAVEIDGRGPTKTIIKQTVKDRVLRNDAPFASFSMPGLQLSGVTLTGGRIAGAGENGGGGLQNNAFMLASKIVIRDNVVTSDAADDISGGGVLTNGVLGLAKSTVRDNLAVGKGDEADPAAAGILVSDGGLTIQDGSRVISNSVELRRPGDSVTAQGGGILVRNPGMETSDVVSIFDSTIAGNSALGAPQASAGGISAGPATNLDISRSTLSGNRSKQGGALYTVGVNSVAINDSTISGNSGGAGAAIFHQADTGAIDVTHVTIAGNKPPAGHFAIEGGEQAQPASLSIFASIVSNRRKQCGGEEGAVSSGGHNVVADKTCAFNPGLGQDIKANPKLRGLADNGGPTRTHALKGSSPAVDHQAGCPAGVDQRGFSRPVGSGCDVGSFERGASAP